MEELEKETINHRIVKTVFNIDTEEFLEIVSANVFDMALLVDFKDEILF